MSIFAPDLKTVTTAGIPEFAGGFELTPALIEDPVAFAAHCESVRKAVFDALAIAAKDGQLNLWRMGWANFRVRAAREAKCGTCGQVISTDEVDIEA